MKFLIDTGTNVSVIPVNPKHTIMNEGLVLYPANRTEIPIYGTQPLTLDRNLCWTFTWSLIIPKVDQSIISIDFLKKFNLFFLPLGFLATKRRVNVQVC